MDKQAQINYLNRLIGSEVSKRKYLRDKITKLIDDIQEHPELSTHYIVGRLQSIIELNKN